MKPLRRSELVHPSNLTDLELGLFAAEREACQSEDRAREAMKEKEFYARVRLLSLSTLFDAVATNIVSVLDDLGLRHKRS